MGSKPVIPASLDSSAYSSTKNGTTKFNYNNTNANYCGSLTEYSNLAVKVGQAEYRIAYYTLAILNAKSSDLSKNQKLIVEPKPSLQDFALDLPYSNKYVSTYFKLYQ